MPFPLILLPPSEGKAPGGRGRRAPDRFGPYLRTERSAVLDALAKAVESARERELAKLLRVRGALLDRAIAATTHLIDGTAPLLPAWMRYSGVVWEHLEPATISPATRARILVPSAIYGITSAQDQIADYRLGMQTTLPGVGNVARFWRASLADLVRPTRRNTIIDLLPTEHRGAFDWRRLGPVTEVNFVDATGRGAAGHAAKAAKGRFARHLIDHGTDEALAFRFEGWKIRPTERGFELRAPR